MSNKIGVIILLIAFSIYLSSQKVEQNWIINTDLSKDETLILNVSNDTDGNVVFEFINQANDSLYLFDSYLDGTYSIINEDLYGSKYLHRYDMKLKECKLSFLPILPFLSVNYTDVVVAGENKLIRKGQILYHFKPIPPQSCIQIAVPRKVFYSKEYVKEITLKDYSKFDSTIKFKDVIPKRCQRIKVEFAIYKDVSLLTSYDAFYFDELNFNKQALSYEVFSVSMDLLD